MIFTEATNLRVRTTQAITAALQNSSFVAFWTYLATTISSVITGSVGLIKNGTGALTLSGSNTYAGGVTLNAGKLVINNNSALGSGTFTIGGNGTVQIDTMSSPLTLTNAQIWNANFGYVTVTGNRAINMNGNVTLGGNRTVNVAGSSSTLAVGGIISDIGNGYSLTKTGVDTLQLAGANTYTGATTILGGNLTVTTLANGGVASALGASSSAASNLVIDGGALQLNTTSSSTDRLFTIGTNGATLYANVNNMTFTNTGALAFTGSGNRTLTLNEGNRRGSLAAAIGDGTGGATSLVKSGGNTPDSGWTLSGNNTYTGQTTLNGWGLLALNSTNALGNTSKINFKNTGPMSMATILSFNVAPGTDYSSVFSNDANQLYRLGVATGVSVTLGGNLSSSGGSLEKLGTGALTLSGNNTYTGSTSITAGSLITTKLVSGPSGKFSQATFTPTALTVTFSTPPVAGETYRLLPGATTQTYASVTLVGAPLRTATYNSATSTLAIA